MDRLVDAKAGISKLVADAAKPKKRRRASVTHVKVFGNNTVIHQHIVVHASDAKTNGEER